MATMHVDGDECGARRSMETMINHSFVRLKPVLALFAGESMPLPGRVANPSGSSSEQK